jgi:hypothetical protein
MFEEMFNGTFDAVQYGRKKVVAHFKDGSLVKGYTQDFAPPNKIFTIVSTHSEDDIAEVDMQLLKALFFVKTFEGNNKYNEKNRFQEASASNLHGLKVKVVFHDGEVIRGTTPDYRNIFTGFYLKPIDTRCNNELIYVLAESPLDIAIGTLAEA